MRKRGFGQAKQEILQALRDGCFQHEPRETLDEKNLLAVGDVDADFVAMLVEVTNARQGQESRHHYLDVQVWVFTPTVDSGTWYVKFYFIEQAWFISVHPVHASKEQP